MVKRNKIHYALHPHYSILVSACGNIINPLKCKLAHWRKNVTCRNCKRTKEFKRGKR